MKKILFICVLLSGACYGAGLRTGPSFFFPPQTISCDQNGCHVPKQFLRYYWVDYPVKNQTYQFQSFLYYSESGTPRITVVEYKAGNDIMYLAPNEGGPYTKPYHDFQNNWHCATSVDCQCSGTYYRCPYTTV